MFNSTWKQCCRYFNSVLASQVWEVAVPYIEKYRIEHIPESRPVSPTAFSLESLRKNSIKIPESEDL
jgi:histidine ammonia-lyase